MNYVNVAIVFAQQGRIATLEVRRASEMGYPLSTVNSSINSSINVAYIVQLMLKQPQVERMATNNTALHASASPTPPSRAHSPLGVGYDALVPHVHSSTCNHAPARYGAVSTAGILNDTSRLKAALDSGGSTEEVDNVCDADFGMTALVFARASTILHRNSRVSSSCRLCCR